MNNHFLKLNCLALTFFVFFSNAYSRITCENFIKNCRETKERCIQASVKFCESNAEAEKIYGQFHGGPILLEGFFKDKSGDKKILRSPDEKETRRGDFIGTETEKEKKALLSAPVMSGTDKENRQLSFLHTKKAQVRFKLKDYQGVLHHTAKAINYYPSNKDAYRLQIIANYEKADYAALIRDCDAYLKIVPNDADIYGYKALGILKTENPGQAYKIASYAVELDPNRAFAYFVKALSALELKNYHQMLEDMYIAAKLDGKYADKFKNLYERYKESAGDFQYKGDLHYPGRETPDAKPKDPVGFIIFAIIVIAAFVLFAIFRNDKTPKGKNSGLLLKQYKIREKIGEGGIGIVYKGFDVVLKRSVAVKKLRTDFTPNKEIKEQMLEEARMVASLEHPNILEIYTVFEEEGNLYLIFEFLQGQTLAEKLKIEGPLSFPKAKLLFADICNALEYAHSRNIIHRDLKPANIMITDSGIVKVMDFGIAKSTGEKSATGSGTPAYMPPEQSKGIIRKESDVYALGICLYEALTGHVPWELESYDHKKNNIILPSEIISGISREIDELIRATINEDLNKRIKTVSEFCKILSSIKS